MPTVQMVAQLLIKHFPTAYTPDNNVVQRSWDIYAGFSQHEVTISKENREHNLSAILIMDADLAQNLCERRLAATFRGWKPLTQVHHFKMRIAANL